MCFDEYFGLQLGMGGINTNHHDLCAWYILDVNKVCLLYVLHSYLDSILRVSKTNTDSNTLRANTHPNTVVTHTNTLMKNVQYVPNRSPTWSLFALDMPNSTLPVLQSNAYNWPSLQFSRPLFVDKMRQPKPLLAATACKQRTNAQLNSAQATTSERVTATQLRSCGCSYADFTRGVVCLKGCWQQTASCLHHCLFCRQNCCR